jgi:hypothetical protein
MPLSRSAADKMEKQLRRYKRRLKDHHKEPCSPLMFSNAPTYMLAGSDADTEDAEPESLQPIIVAEMETKIPSLSVGEAVMQMEIRRGAAAGVPQRRP